MNEKTSVFEAIERLVTTEIRLYSKKRGFVPRLYEAARGNGNPITQDIATDILAAIASGKKRFGIVTGCYVPDRMPDGENDGPYGAAIMARALLALGGEPVILTEAPVAEPMRKLLKFLDIACRVIELHPSDAAANGKFADDLDAVLYTEKIGPSIEGVYHSATGTPMEGITSPLDDFVEKMEASGKLTIATGDNGNEIGNFKVYEAAREYLIPTGKSCRCPKNEGVVCKWGAKHFLPVNCSNVGVYAMVAGLALESGNLDILHTGELESKIIRYGNDVLGLMDGGRAKPIYAVDAMPEKVVVGLVDIMHTQVTHFYDREVRPF